MLSPNNKKTERVTARITTEVKDQCIEAANIYGIPVSQFLVQAMVEKSQAVIKQERVLQLSERDAIMLVEALDAEPKMNPELQKAAELYANETKW
jgi:uncharacterized protein (DUF1778 family)